MQQAPRQAARPSAPAGRRLLAACAAAVITFSPAAFSDMAAAQTAGAARGLAPTPDPEAPADLNRAINPPNPNQRQRKIEPSTAPARLARPETPSKPDAWPRLDPGAVFCRTAADMDQHLAAVSARLDRRASAVPDSLGCSVIAFATPVTIIAREGPGRTQVRLSSPPGLTGFTDAFLPDRRTGP